jgi:hypothetical protein
VDAPIAISLLSAGAKDPTRSGMRDFCYAAGIQDANAWCAGNANAMVDFTAAILRSRATSQQVVMLKAWSSVVYGPFGKDVINGMDDEHRVQLLLSLTGNFDMCRQWSDASQFGTGSLTQFKDVARALFPQLPPSSQTPTALPALIKQGQWPSAVALLISALVSTDAKQAMSCVQAVYKAPDQAGRMQDILRTWSKFASTDKDLAPVVSLIRSNMLAKIAASSRPTGADNVPKPAKPTAL